MLASGTVQPIRIVLVLRQTKLNSTQIIFGERRDSSGDAAGVVHESK